MLFNETLAYPTTYSSTLSRIEQFTNSNTEALITFVIPSINRNTLPRTLRSILQQTNPNWKTIIVFDGCEPTDEGLLSILQDSRFLYVPVTRTGSQQNVFHGQAGFVRNIGMQFVTTPWIGFIDDDDVIIPTYIECLEEEICATPCADAISFKMICDSQIFPPVNYSDITQNTIGISFTMKSSLVKEGFVFKQSTSEDFELLNRLKESQKTMVLSRFITYLVRDAAFTEHTPSERVVINPK